MWFFEAFQKLWYLCWKSLLKETLQLQFLHVVTWDVSQNMVWKVCNSLWSQAKMIIIHTNMCHSLHLTNVMAVFLFIIIFYWNSFCLAFIGSDASMAERWILHVLHHNLRNGLHVLNNWLFTEHKIGFDFPKLLFGKEKRLGRRDSSAWLCRNRHQKYNYSGYFLAYVYITGNVV